jgi:hypothetical protein
MSVIWDYAACLVVALFSGTLLFTLSAMGVMLWTGLVITWRRSRELVPVMIRTEASWTPEPRVP